VRRDEASFIAQVGTTSNCDNAVKYSIVNGQLFLDGKIVSMTPGQAFAPLGQSNGGSISRTFSIEDSTLIWRHPSFDGGVAKFCLTPGGILEAVFKANGAPPNCRPIILAAIPGE
jgi:hypothetical protein